MSGLPRSSPALRSRSDRGNEFILVDKELVPILGQNHETYQLGNGRVTSSREHRGQGFAFTLTVLRPAIMNRAKVDRERVSNDEIDGLLERYESLVCLRELHR